MVFHLQVMPNDSSVKRQDGKFNRQRLDERYQPSEVPTVDINLSHIEFRLRAQFVVVLLHLEDTSLLLVVGVIGAAVDARLHALELLPGCLEADCIAAEAIASLQQLHAVEGEDCCAAGLQSRGILMSQGEDGVASCIELSVGQQFTSLVEHKECLIFRCLLRGLATPHKRCDKEGKQDSIVVNLSHIDCKNRSFFKKGRARERLFNYFYYFCSSF